MATINLTWTPAGGTNSTGQKVQRKSGGSAFADIATLSASASTYSDTTAVNNVLYTYQILNICAYGGPTDSGDVSKGVPLCPTVERTVAENFVTLSFPGLSGDAIYTGTVEVVGIGSFDSSGTNAGFTVQFDGEFSATYNYSFSISVGDETIPCGGSVTTGAAPTCPSPTGLSATVETGGDIR
jgi:hypothetical protein